MDNLRNNIVWWGCNFLINKIATDEYRWGLNMVINRGRSVLNEELAAKQAKDDCTSDEGQGIV